MARGKAEAGTFGHICPHEFYFTLPIACDKWPPCHSQPLPSVKPREGTSSCGELLGSLFKVLGCSFSLALAPSRAQAAPS